MAAKGISSDTEPDVSFLVWRARLPAIAPYSLVARINVNDRIHATTKLDADPWYHVAMTCSPSGANWQVRLYLDSQEVGSGTSKSLPVSATVPDSLVLGAELFYFHGAYYRGLMSDVKVMARAFRADEVPLLLNSSPQ